MPNPFAVLGDEGSERDGSSDSDAGEHAADGGETCDAKKLKEPMTGKKRDREESDDSDGTDVDETIVVETKPKRRQQKRQLSLVTAASASKQADALSLVAAGECEGVSFSQEEISTTLRVITALGKNLDVFKSSVFRPLRAALHPLIDEQMKKYEVPKGAKGGKRRKKTDREKDWEHVQMTQLRAARRERLEALNEEQDGDAVAELRVLDGVAVTDDGTTHNPAILRITGANEDTIADAMEADETKASTQSTSGASKLLENALKCYTCKAPFYEVHFFYDQLCPQCAELNYRKRDEKADMTGKVCLVTGARVKIGYRCALKLLRCNAIVIATSRFPLDCAERFAKEKDFLVWKHNLKIYALDFRDLKLLEQFCTHLYTEYDRLDVIINNACQTVRRPTVYYEHLLEKEAAIEDSSRDVKRLIAPVPGHGNTPAKSIANTASSEKGKGPAVDGSLSKRDTEAINSFTNAPSSVAMSQMAVVEEDTSVDKSLFPKGVTDVNGQQVDLREKHSWTLKLDEVPTGEFAEVLAINTMAPFILNSRLKALMNRVKDEDKFIVNVSAMEGKFYRYKSDKHPHTNMAKAALNMMTRTSAKDYKESRIYMTSVDTGWINDENPLPKAAKIAEKHNFQTPLDEIDAAARVLDPVIYPIRMQQLGTPVPPECGVFLKDYERCDW